jgi:uncharacterized membrane protein YhaH (DUF805 family)
MDEIDFNKLWQNFLDTVTNHYADFSGRVGRGRFWYYVLVYFVVGLGVSIIGSILFLHGSLRAVYSLLLLLPSVGITARRLQDTGRPGSLAWLLLLPYALVIFTGLITVITFLTFGIGAILFVLVPIASLISLVAIGLLIYFCAQPGEAGPNAYGAPPPAWNPNREAAPPPTPPPAT